LLSILPAKSIVVLPEQYAKIVYDELRPFFPDDFDIDLNGRALPWEAACLIPFIEEDKFISLE
jgi:5'-3' exonuclease